MIAAGLDIGGTKIETQVFDSDWALVERRRVATPQTYDALLETVVEQIMWAQTVAAETVAVGIGAAGLVHPETELVLGANLAASGKHSTVMAVILGTGIGGGIAVDGVVAQGATGMAGEFGHIAASADVIVRYGLPIWPCGCGRQGCIETYVAGAGLQRLALHVTGQVVTPEQIGQRRTGDMAHVWEIWCALAAEFIHTLTLIADPDVIVLGGGLSKTDGITDDLTRAAQAVQLSGFAVPPIVLATGGDTSGARGAAYTAWKATT